MQPAIHVSWPHILLGVVGAFIWGGIWYGPLFGKTWCGLMGFPADFKPTPGEMKKAFGLQILGAFLVAYVTTFTLKVWLPSSWMNGADDGGPRWMFGVYNAFFIWLGYYVPQQLGKVAWERRPWKLFFINVGHDLVNLLIISEAVAYGK